MVLNDTIKLNVEKKFKTCFYTRLFIRGGKSWEYKLNIFCVRFVSSIKYIIQKKWENIIPNTYFNLKIRFYFAGKVLLHYTTTLFFRQSRTDFLKTWWYTYIWYLSFSIEYFNHFAINSVNSCMMMVNLTYIGFIKIYLM